MICIQCRNAISVERLIVAPTTTLCTTCASRVGAKKYKGAMIWSHKTAPTIQVMNDSVFHNEWEKYNPKFGRGSGVHKMSPRMAGTG
jgi:hypothetical protein